MDDPLLSLSAESLAFVEALYARYLEDPSSVDGGWRRTFEGLAVEDGDVAAARRAVDGPRFRPASIFNPPAGPGPTAAPPARAGLPALPEGELAERVRLLGEVKLLRGLPADELALIARSTEPQELADGDFLFREGEEGHSFAVVTGGHLLVRRGEHVLATLNAGDVVGELAVLDAQPRSADVVAHGAARVLRLEGRDLVALVERRPTLAAGLIQILSNRLRQRGSRQDKVNQLIHAYRVRGHLLAELDPLGGGPERSYPELELAHYDLSEKDLDSLFSSTMIRGTSVLTLREILALLRDTYCGSVGVQFMHIDELRPKRWLQARLEDPRFHRRLERDEQLRILTKLTDAKFLEQFIHKKYLGAKRFSLEGAETLIPLLDLAIEEAGAQGVEEVVLGMAHRGRLNVLVNILGKSPRQVFREFEDDDPEEHIGRGDVKYHLGFSNDVETASGHRLHLSLCFNPSHLEFVDPVVVGRVRAKQDRFGDRERRRCLGIVIHGDAAMAGEGVVQEMLNMSALEGYRTGGTLHVVVNNQLGFTTPPESGRSTRYATDLARMLQTPVFHVNGEKPEAVAHVVRLAMDYRKELRQDVVIDMYCYRRYGHNEGDEPAYTQPLLYAKIRRQPPVHEAYLESLLELGGVRREEAEEIERRQRAKLEEELSAARDPGYRLRGPASGEGLWRPYVGGPDAEVPEVDTGVPRDRLAALLHRASEVPEGFHLHKKLRRLIEDRRAMAEDEKPLDWGAAEALAFASLLAEGTRVRLSGQDSARGTFSHRHAVLHDTEDGSLYTPLQQLTDDQASFEIWDSPLSEVGVLGFEYGYSLDTPDGLTLWEAQFGDFANVAQVIIDQFIASGEDKWQRLSGLVMLLPHGFEGQGPEHSSARLERFLNLAAEDNVQVVNLTTPAQLFHCLRRQVLRPWRKPLVVMSPKSLLRHPEAVSPLAELTSGRFRRVLGDATEMAADGGVRRVLLTSGKLYYELAAERRDREHRDVTIVRLEQYYPLSLDLLAEAFEPYPATTPVVWVQEEPRNMGAWPFLKQRLGDELLGRPFSCLSRPESASPATGSKAAHEQEQRELLAQAFA